MSSETSGAEPAAGKAKGGSGFDLTKLLNKLRNRIKTIHLTNKVGSGEVDGKSTLQMLHEIESVLIKYTRNVARRRKRDADVVRGIETDQGQIYKGTKSA